MEEMARTQRRAGVAPNAAPSSSAAGGPSKAEVWNGEFYVQNVDFERYPEQNWGQGCHADQLLGQWWAHLLGLGASARARARAERGEGDRRAQFPDQFRGFEQKPRVYCTDDDQGLLICTWPNGGRPAVVTQYSDEIWTGIEYAVAGAPACKRASRTWR